MVLKRLKLHQFLHEIFPTRKHGCRKGDTNFKNFSNKGCFLSF